MDGNAEVLAATIAAAVALVLGLANLIYARKDRKESARQAKELQELQDEREKRRSENDARRDYRYEALKRLYTECEPLLFQIVDAAQLAEECIQNLSSSKMWGRLAVDDGRDWSWIPVKTTEIISTSYGLLLPLAYQKLLRERLTYVDLNLDQRTAVLFELSQAAYEVWQMDAIAAAIRSPADNAILGYNPQSENWREKRRKEPQKFWWQGVSRGRLDIGLGLIITEHDLEKRWRVLSFGEFENLYLQVAQEGLDIEQKTLGVICNPLFSYTPRDRPVFTRILFAKMIIYSAISEFGKHSNPMPRHILDFVSHHEIGGVEPWRDSFRESPDDFFEDPDESLDVGRKLVQRIVRHRLASAMSAQSEPGSEAC